MLDHTVCAEVISILIPDSNTQSSDYSIQRGTYSLLTSLRVATIIIVFCQSAGNLFWV